MAPPGNSWVECPGPEEHFRFVKVQLKSGHVHQQVVKVACPSLHHIAMVSASVALQKTTSALYSAECSNAGDVRVLL